MDAPTQNPPAVHHRSPTTTTTMTSPVDINQDSITEEEEEESRHHPAPPPRHNNKSEQQQHPLHAAAADEKSIANKKYMPLLVTNYLLLFVGSVSSSMLSKYYFIHKGSSKWVSTWVQCAGFPLLTLPIFLPHYLLKSTARIPFADFTPKLLSLSVFVGLMLGINNLLISWGTAYLPVSTASLLLSSQLVFNLILSVIIVRQRVTFLNLNSVILITLSSVILALNSSNERPPGLTQKDYFIGFFCTIGAGLLFATYLPVVEKIYKKVYCYEMVMEMQFVMEIAATVLATAGMALDGGFHEMKEEGMRVFDKGETVYWVTIMSTVVTWQFCFMGTAGMVFLTSSLTGGICTTALLSMNVLGGVVVFSDKFGGFKAVSTVLCLWGFCSYVYGLYTKVAEEKARMKNKSKESSSTELVSIVNHGVSH